MQRQPRDEVLVVDVDEELPRRTPDGRAHRGLDLRIERGSRAHLLGDAAGRDDAGEHERRQVLHVALSQPHTEVLLHETLDHGRDVGTGDLAGRGVVRERMPVGDPVGGDGDVHDDVGDAELVDVVPEAAELCHEVGLERAERVGVDRGAGKAPPQCAEVERSGLHLVVREPAEKSPSRHLAAAEARRGRRALERQLGAAEKTPHPGEVGLERGGADVELHRGVEQVDPGVGVEQTPDDGVQAIARRPGIRPPARPEGRGAFGARPVTERSRFDRDAGRDARVDGGDVRPDAAGRDPERVGKRRRGRPGAVA